VKKETAEGMCETFCIGKTEDGQGVEYRFILQHLQVTYKTIAKKSEFVNDSPKGLILYNLYSFTFF
jgi:hypothetical protein